MISLVFALIIIGSLATVNAETYNQTLVFGASYLNGPYGIAINDAGVVSVIDASNSRIVNFRGSDGYYLSYWGNSLFNGPAT